MGTGILRPGLPDVNPCEGTAQTDFPLIRPPDRYRGPIADQCSWRSRMVAGRSCSAAMTCGPGSVPMSVIT
jgi:hypothetical protein